MKSKAIPAQLCGCILGVWLGLGLVDLVDAQPTAPAGQGLESPENVRRQNAEVVRLLSAGKHQEALALSAANLRDATTLLGERHPDTLTSLNNYAAVLKSLGRAREALPHDERTLKLRTEVLGERHPDALASLNNYAAVLVSLGREREAMPYLARALKLCTEVLGERHPGTLATLNNYAFVLGKSLGRAREALPHFARALKLSTDVLGERHPDTLVSLNNYAAVLKSLGRAREALPYYEGALKVRTEVLGERHPDTLGSLNNYAGVLLSVGRAREALPYYERALKLRTAVLGERHPDTLESLSTYGEALSTLKRAPDALPYHERALKLRAEVLGERHPDTLTSLSNYAALLNSLGRAREALPYRERELKLSTEVLGERHPDALASLNNYASLLVSLGREHEALPYYKRVLMLTTDVLGDRHHGTLASLYGYAYALQSVGRARESLPYLERYVTGVEFLRADAGGEGAATQQSILASYIFGYHNYLSALRSSERLPEAFNLSERTKARTLLEEINYKLAVAASDLPKAEAQRLESLHQQIGGLDTRIAMLDQDAEREALKAERNAASRELGALRARLQKQYPKYRQLTEVQLATVADATSLPADSLFISFVVMGEKVVKALTLTARGEVSWVDVAELPRLADTVEALRLWSANLTQAAIRDDADQPVRVARWSEGGEPRWRAVPQGRACTKEDLESERSKSERTGQRSRGQIDPNAPVIDAGNAGVECLPPGAVVVSTLAQYQELLNYLGNKLIAPLKDQLQGKKQLIISPDGPLALVPWDLLSLQGQPLAAGYDIHQVQSLSVYKLVRQRQAEYRSRTERQGLLGLGDPAYGQQSPSGTNPRSPLQRGSGDDPAQALARLKWADLRFAGQEMQRAQELFKSQGTKLVSREQASESNLRVLSRQGELAKYRHLLFSAHGYFDPNLPEFSSLVLRREGPEPERDGYVTIGEWMGMTLKSDLTLLSACNTARGRNVGGEGLLGLGYALYIAGNANTVLTLWPVNDQATAEFVSRFLAKVRDGQPHPQALAATKREFMNHPNPQLRSPYFWAPFVLYGG